MTRHIFTFCVLAALAASALALAACETAQGFGRDMENAGRSIQRGVN